MKKQLRAVAYPRYSSDNQREESITAQIRAIEEYCERKGYILVDSYPDEARSATTDNRPNFQRMIADSEKDLFDVVVVHKLDRFARDRYDSAYYKRTLKRNGVRLESVLEQLDNSPESIILESVLEGMAEYYSKNLARESRKGMFENATRGLHAGGRPPYGYRVNPQTKKLEIDERAAGAVRHFFEQLAIGKSSTQIAQELNEMGYRTQTGRKFTKNSFDGWARNKKYIGIYTWDVKTQKTDRGTRNNHRYKPEEEQVQVPDSVPPIVDVELWEKVNEAMNGRKWKSSHRKAKVCYLLSDKVFCGKCGARYNGNAYTNKGAQYRYYTCAGKCGNKSIRKDELEQSVVKQLIENCFSDDAMNNIVVRVQELYRTQRTAVVQDIRPIQKEIADIEVKINNWFELLGSGISAKDTLIEKINEATARKEALEAELNRTKILNEQTDIDESKILSTLQAKKHQLFSDDDEEKKLVIQEFADSITINSDETDDFKLTLGLRVMAGGGDGSRTRVRRPRYMNIYGCRLSIKLSLVHADNRAWR